MISLTMEDFFEMEPGEQLVEALQGAVDGLIDLAAMLQKVLQLPKEEMDGDMREIVEIIHRRAKREVEVQIQAAVISAARVNKASFREYADKAIDQISAKHDVSDEMRGQLDKLVREVEAHFGTKH